MLLVGDRAQYEVLLPAASTVVSVYLTGPRGTASVAREYNYPHAEDADGASLVRTTELRYVFTTPRFLQVGYFDLELLTDFGTDTIAQVRTQDVVSSALKVDLGTP